MTKVSFCGISGSGMSALAQILRYKGYEVHGSDRNFDLGRDSFTRQALEDIGITIFPQDGSAVLKDLDFLCTSTAVEDGVPDIKAAKDLGVEIKTRPQLLAEIFHSYKYGIAVGGTSGKTTTTAMIGYALDKLGYEPCMINGGLLSDYVDQAGIPNVICHNGEICVVEADESNGSIDLYNPYVSVINNIAADHKSLEELAELFQHFADRTAHRVVVNADYELCRGIKSDKAVYFSLQDSQADFYALRIKPLPQGTEYEFRGHKYTLKLIGAFNVANALAAIAVCSSMGIEVHKVAEVLQNFGGTKRRLEVIGSRNQITVIDDFAHNPDKVRASIAALRQYDGRLIVVFQPHGFAPMRMLGKDIMQVFADYLQKDDILVMPEIFFVGGTVDKDISSKDLIDYARSLGKDQAYFFENKAMAADFVIKKAQKGDRIVIMGARDNTLTDLCYTILERL